ncbi:uncharacterized protein LOC106171699 [Lingula anatina]|uniref:Uncharacterized protein LOC106171699 n=1 Tax=Lingula anatina TaxID=7574 RepID=A0A1S3JB20_LINAN|nr:uncharacterized protein LOC106171699 [Lingula anatina]|eukprot:XP_013407600.1 uncharacterized protein LOC106171699 [Lingula anatina]
MDTLHKEILKKFRVRLIDELCDVSTIVEHLFQHDTVTEGLKDKIQATQTEREKIRCLLDILPKRGPEAFRRFLAAVEVSHDWIVRDMREAVILDEAKLTRMKGGVSKNVRDVDPEIRQEVIDFCSKLWREDRYRRIPEFAKSGIEDALTKRLAQEKRLRERQESFFRVTKTQNEALLPELKNKVREMCGRFGDSDTDQQRNRVNDSSDDLEALEIYIRAVRHLLEKNEVRVADCYRIMNLEIPNENRNRLPLSEKIEELLADRDEQIRELRSEKKKLQMEFETFKSAAEYERVKMENQARGYSAEIQCLEDELKNVKMDKSEVLLELQSSREEAASLQMEVETLTKEIMALQSSPRGSVQGHASPRKSLRVDSSLSPARTRSKRR